MIGRLIEDGIFLSKFVYFYAKSSNENKPFGFAPTSTQTPNRIERVKWAWVRAHNIK